MAIPLIQSFSNPTEAVGACIDSGVSIFETGLDVAVIQARYTEYIEQGILGGMSLSAVMQIVPVVEDLMSALDSYGIMRPDTVKTLYQHLETGQGSHLDFEGMSQGITLLIPVAHDSLFTKHTPGNGPRELQASYSPGEILLLRQRINRDPATEHSYNIFTRPEDVKYSGKRIVISLDAPLADRV